MRADPDEQFCDEALGEVSRTFALSIRGLPGGLREPVRTAYLLCRLVDTVEDDRAVCPRARGALFDAFDAALHGAAEGQLGAARVFESLAAAEGLGSGFERTLAVRASAVFRAFAALPHDDRANVRSRILEMSGGMREYAARADRLGRLRIDDLADLERYCHFVAGTVGEFLTDLFAARLPVDSVVRAALDARAARFGLGLQLVNILKDVAEDAARGDCFLPDACAAEHSVSLSRLFEPSERPRALRLCRALSARAREHLAAAQEYTLLWPRTGAGVAARAFCAGPLALALGTLRQIELGTDSLSRHAAPAVSRDFVAAVFSELRHAEAEGLSDATLRRLFERARVGSADRPSRPPEPRQVPAAPPPPRPLPRPTALSVGES